MKKLIGFCYLLSLGFFSPAFAAPGTSLPVEPAPSDSTSKKGWCTIGLEVANNASFFGRNTAIQYPYIAPSLTYTHASGLFISAMSYQLFDTEDFIDETDLTAGYIFNIGKRLDGSVS